MARTAEDKKALDQIHQERAQIVARLHPNVYRQYERIRKGRRGVAIAEAIDGRCSACQIALRLQFFQDLKKGDEVMYCESCARILYYNPPVAFEDLTGESAPAVQG
jgi:predicted  nucleic acid-binding Zn-ribbon protein